MTNRRITYFLELRNVRKLLIHLVLVNFQHFYLGFPRMAPMCRQRYLCTALRVKPKVYMACIWREQN